MKLQRLSGRKRCEYIRRKGKVWKGKHMLVRYEFGAPHHPNIDPEDNAVYLGTYATTKLHKSAVKRNRMRRRCREALRVQIAEAEKLPTVQLLLTPRSSSLEVDFLDIHTDVRTFLTLLSHGRKITK